MRERNTVKIMAKEKILIAEDEGVVAKNIKTMLTNLGYCVSAIVSSGKDAIMKAQETQPDLILMDIKLKGNMDGIKAAEKIHLRFDIPVIFLTAYSDEATLHRAKKIEPFGYILKPFEERDLHTAIAVALYKSKMEKRVKEREQWVSTLLKSIGDAVIAVDKEGAITYMNSVAEALTGWKHKEALGKDLTERLNLEFDEKTYLFSENPEIKKNRKENIQLVDQATLISEKGEEIPIDYSDAAIVDAKGKIMGNVLVLRDISEKKKAEEEIKQSWFKLQKAMEGSIQAISMISETRDPYTAGHQRRVSQLSCAIARAMGLSKDRIDGIRTASLIHDIGKIYVPVEILNKPGRLTEIEFSLIKTHSKVGYEIIKTIEFPWPVAQIILQHHERMDGSGYPQGLTGKEILLEAKIISVADVVEAMASHRPYRPALGIKKSLEEISQNQDVLYDNEGADVCLKLFKENKFKFK